MHKIILAILLATMSNGAMAGWMQFGSNRFFTAYYDPSTIHKDHDKVKVIVLKDFNFPMDGLSGEFPNVKSEKYSSLKGEFEYDCTNVLIRLNTSTMHSKNMGKGKVNYTDSSPGTWDRPESGSVEFPPFKSICN